MKIRRLALPGVMLSAGIIELIAQYSAQSVDGYETGGILVGREITDEGLVVSSASGPGPEARREALSFHRDLAHAKNFAAEAYRDRRDLWVGEWHTHPSGLAEPSNVDLRTYLRHLEDPELEFDQFLSIVVTPDGESWTELSLHVWLCTRSFVSLRGAVHGVMVER